MEKDIFIHATKMVEIAGETTLPTAIYYGPKGQLYFGSAAIEAAGSPHRAIADFKIELGEIEPHQRNRRTPFFTESGAPKSALDLTNDFLRELVKSARSAIADLGRASPTSIMVAEPLSLENQVASGTWLSNYRSHIKSVLAGCGFTDVEFLPEPFAAFQYYRYGERHPLVAGRTKQNALVIDFGGGTCDICIIETTRDGDISQSGRNSRPLAATSQPAGGFLIDRLLALGAYQQNLGPRSQPRLNRGMEFYHRWRRGKQDLASLAPEWRNFIQNLHEAAFRLEAPKLAVCRDVLDWGLAGHPTARCTVPIPRDPFSDGGETIQYTLTAEGLKDLFVQKVWKDYIRPALAQTLRRGSQELDGAPISIVLLSGGSSNIGWLRSLIQDEFGSIELANAEVLQLPDYQEVVAKGLALECARRFYTETGDFTSVTYNRLCLLLEPDDSGCEARPFTATSDDLPNAQNELGVLLPSAAALKNHLGRPMEWRVRLNKPPRRHLDYYFMRSSRDHKDIANRYNVEHRRIHTPQDTGFDASLHVELTVREDGTATPRFIYRRGKHSGDLAAATGQPFYIDMTDGVAVNAKPDTYIGLDFGTCNTSVSLVDRDSVGIYRGRSGDAQWRELTDLANILPYPLAITLAHYLAETDRERLISKAFDFVETALAFCGYIAYLDVCSRPSRATTRLFKGLTQRSAGPLWHFLQQVAGASDPSSPLTRPLHQLLKSQEQFARVDGAIAAWARFKHNKADAESIDHCGPATILANTSNKMFAQNEFGYFENVQMRRYGKAFEGLFRHATGSGAFTTTSKYSGETPFANLDAAVVDTSNGRILTLAPLLLWEECPAHRNTDPPGHCYIYDGGVRSGGKYSYKACGFPCTLEAELKGPRVELARELAGMEITDLKADCSTGQMTDYAAATAKAYQSPA